MKKLILVLTMLLFSTTAMAAWTATAKKSEYFPFKWGNDAYMFCFEIEVISDANASGDLKLSTLLKNTNGEQEANEPGGVTPTTESTITIDKETTALIFSELVTTAATAQGWRGDTDTSKYVPVTDVILAMTSMDNTTQATIKLWFLGGN